MELNGIGEKIDQFLDNNKRKIEDFEFYYSIDDNRDHVNDFTDDKLKVLCVYASTAKTRSVSNTCNALTSIAKMEDPDNIAVDHAWVPNPVNQELFRENGIPYIFGTATHQPVGFYDVIYFSNALVPEILNVPHMWYYSGIPLTIQERDKEDMPLIIMGGAAANEAALAYGPIKRDGKDIGNSLVDVCMYGYGENILNVVTKTLLDYKKGGMNLHERKKVRDRMIDDGVKHDYLFYPEYYQWVYEDDRFTIKEIKKLDDRLPDFVKYNRIHPNQDMGWNTKMFYLSGDNASSHDIMISSGCTGASSNCSFCMEATVAGGYREKDLDKVEEAMKDAVRYAAPNTASYYSYNLNYYYRFMDLLATSSQYFSSISLLNERLDVVANAPEQMQLAKRMGLKRFSGAVEGIGERVRNGLLNKNLTRETLMKAVDVITRLGLMHVKIGLILTGEETPEDWADFLDEFKTMVEIQKKNGSNNSWQANVTPLVIYSQIALCYFPRTMAEWSFKEIRAAKEYIPQFRELGLRMKFNGRGYGTWLEQLFLDFGPIGTDWLIGFTLDEDIIHNGIMGTKFRDAAVRQLEKRGYKDPIFFCKERPENWIFPNDHLQSISPKLRKMWWDKTLAWKAGDKHAFDSKLCLRTPANMEGGKCYGCQMCETPEEIKGMVKREIWSEHTLDEVAELLSGQRSSQTIRFVVKKKSKWWFANTRTLAHFITSRLNTVSEELANAFYQVGKDSHQWITSNDQRGWVGGKFAFDLDLRTKVSRDEVLRAVEEANKCLESCQIVNTLFDVDGLNMKTTNVMAYIGQTNVYTLNQFKDGMSNWNGKVYKAIKAMGIGLQTEEVDVDTLSDKVFVVQNGNKIQIGLVMPAGFNPYLVMMSILRIGQKKAFENFQFDMIDHVELADMLSKDGNPVGYSYFTGQYNKRSLQEIVKIYLAKLTGKI